MIPQHTKAEIVTKLEQVPTQTLWGLGIQAFLNNISCKVDEDFTGLISDIKSAIQDGPNHMKEILGDSFSYFNTVQL